MFTSNFRLCLGKKVDSECPEGYMKTFAFSIRTRYSNFTNHLIITSICHIYSVHLVVDTEKSSLTVHLTLHPLVLLYQDSNVGMKISWI